MKNILYYHLYCCDNQSVWKKILFEQIEKTVQSGLMRHLNKIKVTAIIQNTETVESLAEYLSDYKVEIDIEPVSNPYDSDIEMISQINTDKTITENYTMRKIYRDCMESSEPFNVCYIHSKGITAHLKEELTRQSMYALWRQFLDWGVIENWKACVDALKSHDIAGVNFYEYPSKHFSGNFWWAKSDYIKRLPDPSTLNWWKNIKKETSDSWLKNVSDRFRDEQWPCSLPEAKIFNLYTHSTINPSSGFLKREEYKDKI